MTNTMQYKGNQGSNTPNTGRGPSPWIWGDCPVQDLISGVREGIHFFDDFLTPAFTTPTTEANWGPFYKAFTSTGGALLPASPEWGGILGLLSDGDDEGASVATVGLPFQISRSHGKLWFECRVKFSTIADTKFDAFIGFGDQMTLTATVPITATAGAMADENWVGFHRLGTDGDYIDCRYKADGVTAVTSGSDAQVLVADTYVKLGMVYDPDDNYYLRFYGNGIEIANKQIPSAAGTDFPNDVPLGLVMAMLNAAAAGGTFSVDWWRAAQLAP